MIPKYLNRFYMSGKRMILGCQNNAQLLGKLTDQLCVRDRRGSFSHSVAREERTPQDLLPGNGLLYWRWKAL